VNTFDQTSPSCEPAQHSCISPDFCPPHQTHSQVLRFGGKYLFLWNVQNKFSWAQHSLGALPPNVHTHGYGPSPSERFQITGGTSNDVTTDDAQNNKIGIFYFTLSFFLVTVTHPRILYVTFKFRVALVIIVFNCPLTSAETTCHCWI